MSPKPSLVGAGLVLAGALALSACSSTSSTILRSLSCLQACMAAAHMATRSGSGMTNCRAMRM